MTLHNASRDEIEDPQAAAIQNAGSSLMEGNFKFYGYGWELTLKALTFNQVLRIVEAAEQILR